MEASGRSGQPPRIVSPAQGRVYALSSRGAEQETVALQASSEADVTRLYWFADKAFLGAVSPREALHWRPTPGVYRIMAMDDRGRSSAATVTLQMAAAE